MIQNEVELFSLRMSRTVHSNHVPHPVWFIASKWEVIQLGEKLKTAKVKPVTDMIWATLKVPGDVRVSPYEAGHKVEVML